MNSEYLDIFDNGYSVDSIFKNISLKNPSLNFVPGKTLIFFDEIQKCISAATSLKVFREDGRYDVICSGSLMGLSYKEIESVSIGNKIDFNMYSMDFEEFLWSLGYTDEVIDDLYRHMKTLAPLSNLEFKVFLDYFHEYMVLGGMPAVVSLFVEQKIIVESLISKDKSFLIMKKTSLNMLKD